MQSKTLSISWGREKIHSFQGCFPRECSVFRTGMWSHFCIHCAAIVSLYCSIGEEELFGWIVGLFQLHIHYSPFSTMPYLLALHDLALMSACLILGSSIVAKHCPGVSRPSSLYWPWARREPWGSRVYDWQPCTWFTLPRLLPQMLQEGWLLEINRLILVCRRSGRVPDHYF